MNWLDLTLMFVMLTYIWGGFSGGLIQAVGGILGLIVGSTVASRTYETFAPQIAPLVGGGELVSKIVAFALIFFILTRLVSALVWFVNKLFNILAIVPGLKLLNKFGGAVFGFLEGAIFLGLTLQFVNRLPVPSDWAANMNESFMVPFLLGISGWLVPFLPKALKESQKAIDQYLQYGDSAQKTLKYIQENDLLNKAQQLQNINSGIPR